MYQNNTLYFITIIKIKIDIIYQIYLIMQI